MGAGLRDAGGNGGFYKVILPLAFVDHLELVLGGSNAFGDLYGAACGEIPSHDGEVADEFAELAIGQYQVNETANVLRCCNIMSTNGKESVNAKAYQRWHLP